MNTSEKSIKIKKTNLINNSDLDYLENCHVCSSSQSQNVVERVNKLLLELRHHIYGANGCSFDVFLCNTTVHTETKYLLVV